MPSSANRVLNALPQNIFAAVAREMKPVIMKFGAVLAEPGQPAELVYFPDSGVISLVVLMQGGETIATGMVGRDGVLNGIAALDGKVARHRAHVQVAGAAMAIKAHALLSLADEFEPLRAILIWHEQVLLAAAQQSAGCNACHAIPARMCRWLLRFET